MRFSVSYPLSRLALVVSAGILLLAATNIRWHGEHWKLIIRSDGKGYYAYLPAVLIHHDVNFGFFDQLEADTYYHSHTFQDYRYQHEGHTVNQYFMGVAVLQTPFFLMGHLLTRLSGGSADGYSRLYYYAFHLGAIFFTLLGAWYTVQILRDQGITDAHTSLVLLAFIFGTNVFYYVVCEPGMSHIYSWATIAGFARASSRYLSQKGPRWLIQAGLWLGLSILLRPVNGLVVLSLPFLAGTLPALKKAWRGLREDRVSFGVAILAAAAIPSLQFLMYYLQTGTPWVYAYGSAGFNWGDPHFFDILFSYRKGLFIYTPLCLLSLVGLWVWQQKSRFAALSWLGFMGVVVYVLSAWAFWDYGGSFSSRPFIDYYVFFAMALAAALAGLKQGWPRISYLTGIVLLTLICQIQTYQYRYLHIDVNGMTREKYWDAFLRIDRILWP
ncbi:MAG: hypothetical protein D6722_15395 [Bacteroidetes bacterium]|nr:MAG: hypothetical protein D6722_15395 [Bacteroidota bacterium]